MNKNSRLVSATGALLAIAMSFLAGCSGPAELQDAKAEAAVRAVGGRVHRGETEGRPIIGVDLNGKDFTDAGMKELAGLMSLQGMDLHGTKVTDAGLKELAGLKGLSALRLGETKVTDAGLKELANLKSLRSVELRSTGVTNAGLEDLRKALPNCLISY
jgi:internalin A